MATDELAMNGFRPTATGALEDVPTLTARAPYRLPPVITQAMEEIVNKDGPIGTRTRNKSMTNAGSPMYELSADPESGYVVAIRQQDSPETRFTPINGHNRSNSQRGLPSNAPTGPRLLERAEEAYRVDLNGKRPAEEVKEGEWFAFLPSKRQKL